MFLSSVVSGDLTLVTVHQPPVLAAALGHDVIMPCQLSVSQDEKTEISSILYWIHTTSDTGNSALWLPSQKYRGRVDLLDNNSKSSNKSIRFQKVQWADSGRYLCKVTITTEGDLSFRRRGNETLLMVYDTVLFGLTSHNDSLLHCEVNVTGDPRYILSIHHNGSQSQTGGSSPGDAITFLPYVTLSETVSLRGRGEYECQLHLDGDLITASRFFYSPLESGELVFPEPWLLYLASLLLHVLILLGLLCAELFNIWLDSRH
ncbi:uncharacterized protein ACBR49_004934 isoform 1-T1 [Aulostomus maculatus]